ncbi:MAG: alpha-galactosidase [Bacteroidales bacterium]|nr:alpha-galactosidase [Bacteroidales bacterium]
MKSLYSVLIFLFTTVNTILFAGNSYIQETENPKGWIISTNNSSYKLIVDNQDYVKPVFYGTSANKDIPELPQSITEIPYRGGMPDKLPILEVTFPDHVRDLDLQFVNSEIIEIDNRQTLKITQKDRYYPLEVVSYIRVLPEFDILEKWITVHNTGRKGDILIENLQSGSIILPPDSYELTHLGGRWGAEFQLYETILTPGVKTLQARDFKSYDTPAWFMLRPKEEKDKYRGTAYFGAIQYSGNWIINFETFYNQRLQITSGINFWDTSWSLKPGESFESPRLIIGYTENGSEGAAQNMAGYVRKTILPEKHRNQLRPVLYNSWYATEFDVTEANQLKLAETAKEIGVELFVIDDGWFKGRINDHAGLGDWTVDKNKFPNGLNPLIQKINNMGMDFGIWIEPEMINPNSDLYRKHPDWVLYFPNRKRTEARNQLTLNLAREDVYQYLLESFTQLLKEHNIKFIKWDHNRTLSEPGWPVVSPDKQKEVRIRYIQNLYRLIETLRTRFPKVWFETCSGGGGRADLGMLARMDQAWASDNTNPIDRLFIQYGYLSALPANTMVSWTTDGPADNSLDFKFDVSMSGVLGIGNDLSKWNETEIKTAKQKIALYKELRPLVQQGTTYRLLSPFEGNRCAIEYVNENADSAVVFCYNMAELFPNGNFNERGNSNLKLLGLNDEKNYQIELCGHPASSQPEHSFNGEYLRKTGISWPVYGPEKGMIVRITEK